jgi:hypothetical protein
MPKNIFIFSAFLFAQCEVLIYLYFVTETNQPTKNMKTKSHKFTPCATVTKRKARLVNLYIKASDLFAIAQTDSRRKTLESRRGRIAAAAYEA